MKKTQSMNVIKKKNVSSKNFLQSLDDNKESKLSSSFNNSLKSIFEVKKCQNNIGISKKIRFYRQSQSVEETPPLTVFESWEVERQTEGKSKFAIAQWNFLPYGNQRTKS